MALAEGTVLWTPPRERAEASELARYLRWLAERKGLRFEDYPALQRWSVERVEDFWASLWEFLEIRSSAPYARVLDEHRMPGAKWFEGARLNYAEHALRQASARYPAILARSEARPAQEISWAGLERSVA